MRQIIAVGFLFALCGCSGMPDLFGFGGPDRDDEDIVQAASAPAPMAPAAPNDSFCRGVAVNDATTAGYDPETQKKVATQSYTQCRAIFNR